MPYVDADMVRVVCLNPLPLYLHRAGAAVMENFLALLAVFKITVSGAPLLNNAKF